MATRLSNALAGVMPYAPNIKFNGWAITARTAAEEITYFINNMDNQWSQYYCQIYTRKFNTATRTMGAASLLYSRLSLGQGIIATSTHVYRGKLFIFTMSFIDQNVRSCATPGYPLYTEFGVLYTDVTMTQPLQYAKLYDIPANCWGMPYGKVCATDVANEFLLPYYEEVFTDNTNTVKASNKVSNFKLTFGATGDMSIVRLADVYSGNLAWDETSVAYAPPVNGRSTGVYLQLTRQDPLVGYLGHSWSTDGINWTGGIHATSCGFKNAYVIYAADIDRFVVSWSAVGGAISLKVINPADYNNSAAIIAATNHLVYNVGGWGYGWPEWLNSNEYLVTFYIPVNGTSQGLGDANYNADDWFTIVSSLGAAVVGSEPTPYVEDAWIIKQIFDTVGTATPMVTFGTGLIPVTARILTPSGFRAAKIYEITDSGRIQRPIMVTV